MTSVATAQRLLEITGLTKHFGGLPALQEVGRQAEVAAGVDRLTRLDEGWSHEVRGTLALERGLKLNEYGLFAGRRMVAAASEQEVYQALGLPWIPPELRESGDELAQFVSPELPLGEHVAQAEAEVRWQCWTRSPSPAGRVAPS